MHRANLLVRRNRCSTAARGRRGSTLVMVMVALVAVAGLSLSAVVITNAAAKQQRSTRDRLAAQYVAEAGLAEAVFDLMTGGTGTQGDLQAPDAYGRSSYWVDAVDLGGGMTSLQATGLDRGAGYRIELILQEQSSSLFTWGAFGDVGMSMDSNAHVDSYDSALGAYSDQDVNGSGNSRYALENGNVGSNQNVGLATNSTVHGSAKPGPGGTTTITGNASISGSTTPSAATIALPPLSIPAIPSAGSLSVSSNTTLPAGVYAFDDLLIETGARLAIHGPATIVVTNMTLESNSELLVEASGGGIEVYVLDDFVMNSNTLIASDTYKPADIAINLDSDNVIDPNVTVDLDEVDFDSNAKLFGTLYAPNASIEINSNFELFGSLVAYQVHLDSNSRVHFDEALLTASSSQTKTFSTLMWKGSPYVP